MSNTIKSSNHNINALELYTLRMQEKIKYAGEMKMDLIATLDRAITDDMMFKDMTAREAILPTRIPTALAKGYVMPQNGAEVDMTETHDIKDDITDLLVMCAILPDSKVLGNDMWCRPTDRLGLKGQFDEKVLELQLMSGSKEAFRATMQDIIEEYKDRLQVIFDKEDDLYKNAEIDDLDVAMDKIALEAMETEYQAHASMMGQIQHTADEAINRHERMALRIVMQKTSEEPITDDMVQAAIDNGLSNDLIKMAMKEERIILQKNNATYFRRKLEDKATLLRDLSFKAERMQMGKVPADWAFIAMVTRLANRTKVWCEAQVRKQLPNRAMAAPYSKRAVNALFNEAIDTLVALGVFKQAYHMREWNNTTRKYDGEICSFFTKRTAQDMVHVKTGENWADELRTCYYESEDGNSRTPVRSGSGE
jgi:hypothetical protein